MIITLKHPKKDLVIKLAIGLKKSMYLKAKEEEEEVLWKLKYFTTQKI